MWAQMSLDWGIKCPVQSLANRSLEFFLILKPNQDSQHLKRILERLGSVMGDPIEQVQGYTRQLLQTVEYFMSIETEKQGFWTIGIAFLYSPLVTEYEFGLNVMTKCTNWHSQNLLSLKNVQSHVISLLLRGISILPLHDTCLDILNFLVIQDCFVNHIQLEQECLFYSLLGTLPRIILNFKDVQHSIFKTCLELSQVCHKCHYESLGNVLLSFSKQKFRSKDDFLSQFLSSFKDTFSSRLKELLEFILTLLMHPDEEYKGIILLILDAYIRILQNSPQQELESMNDAKLWAPFISLLQDYYSESLKRVLDTLTSACHNLKSDLKLIFGQQQTESLDRKREFESHYSIDVCRLKMMQVARDVLFQFPSVSSPLTCLTREDESKEWNSIYKQLEELSLSF